MDNNQLFDRVLDRIQNQAELNKEIKNLRRENNELRTELRWERNDNEEIQGFLKTIKKLLKKLEKGKKDKDLVITEISEVIFNWETRLPF